MTKTLQFRMDVKDFEAHKTLAGLEEVSMSALLTAGIDRVADDPALLARVIQCFLEETMGSNDEQAAGLAA